MVYRYSNRRTCATKVQQWLCENPSVQLDKTTAKASPVTITYNYNTGSSLTSMATMDVTDTVECYLLPMSQEYGTVNLPYNVLLPTGATAYAISAASSNAGVQRCPHKG